MFKCQHNKTKVDIESENFLLFLLILVFNFSFKRNEQRHESWFSYSRVTRWCMLGNIWVNRRQQIVANHKIFSESLIKKIVQKKKLKYSCRNAQSLCVRIQRSCRFHYCFWFSWNLWKLLQLLNQQRFGSELPLNFLDNFENE